MKETVKEKEDKEKGGGRGDGLRYKWLKEPLIHNLKLIEKSIRA